MLSAKPLKVIVLYSNQDEIWMQRFLQHMRVLGPAVTTEAFDLQVARTNEIFDLADATAQPGVFVPLISRHLFSAKIQADTLSAYMENARRAGGRVMAAILSPGAWDQVPWLAHLRTWPRNGRSLSGLTEHDVDVELAALVGEIARLIPNGMSHDAIERQALTVSRLGLTGIRRLAHLDLPLLTEAGEPRRCTVFIGRNGTCKTTLLRCLALGLADSADTNALVADPIGRLLTPGNEQGTIALQLLPREGGSEALTLEKEVRDIRGKDVVTAPVAASLAHFPFVCAYGAGRSVSGDELPAVHSTRDSVATLFDYRRPLHGVELSLRRIRDFFEKDPQRYESTMAGFKRVLGLRDTDIIDWPDGGGVRMSGATQEQHIPLEGWADGYRMTFTWLLDFYAWAFKANRIAADGHVDGILLIDEPEQHLHPSMQAAILPRLKAVLPRVQIFVTTHSPLVALGAEPGEVVLLREQGSQVVAEPANFDFSGYSAEDMLVDSRLFDTIPYAPATARKLERYRELTAMQPEQRTPAQTEELRGLARELRSQQLPEVRGGEAERELRALLDKHGL